MGSLVEGRKSLMKPLPPSPLYLCHRDVCLGNALLPLKPHFHLKSTIPQLPLATHSLSLRILHPGPTPARYQLISIPEGTLPTPQGEGKHSSTSLSSRRTAELPLPGGWRTGLQTQEWLLINTFPTKDFV